MLCLKQLRVGGEVFLLMCVFVHSGVVSCLVSSLFGSLRPSLSTPSRVSLSEVNALISKLGTRQGLKDASSQSQDTFLSTCSQILVCLWVCAAALSRWFLLSTCCFLFNEQIRKGVSFSPLVRISFNSCFLLFSLPLSNTESCRFCPTGLDLIVVRCPVLMILTGFPCRGIISKIINRIVGWKELGYNFLRKKNLYRFYIWTC